VLALVTEPLRLLVEVAGLAGAVLVAALLPDARDRVVAVLAVLDEVGAGQPARSAFGAAQRGGAVLDTAGVFG
jgi:hypothetical protein